MADSQTHTVLAIPLTGVLCSVAGSIDVIAYLVFGKIFIANMTGNTVLFAASMVQHNWPEAALRIGVVLSFLFGIFVARAGLRRWAFNKDRPTRLVALTIEFVLLAALALLPQPYTARVELLVLLAFAVGVQNDAFQNIGGTRVNTSFITGDLENLGAALASSNDPAKRSQARRKAVVFFTTWVSYGIGALLGAFGALHFAEKALWIPAALVIVAAIMVLLSPASRRLEAVA